MAKARRQGTRVFFGDLVFVSGGLIGRFEKENAKDRQRPAVDVVFRRAIRCVPRP